MITRRSTVFGTGLGALPLASGRPAIAHVVRTFEETHPGVELKITSMPWQQLSPTLLRASRARCGNVLFALVQRWNLAIGAAAVLVFVTIWNDFLIGFALTLSDEHRMLQVGLQAFVTEGGIDWGPMMAATIFALLPAGLLFAFLQRAFIQGVTGGAVKG